MTNKIPLIKGQMATLTNNAKELLNGVGIGVKRTKGIKVMITQHCHVGTSFHFMNLPQKEYHLPSRIVRQSFVESTSFN